MTDPNDTIRWARERWDNIHSPAHVCPTAVVDALLDVLSAVENDAGEVEAEQRLFDACERALAAIEKERDR